jgi:hypothetical protein
MVTRAFMASPQSDRLAPCNGHYSSPYSRSGVLHRGRSGKPRAPLSLKANT